MSVTLTNERVWLDGSALAFSFATHVACFACELRDGRGGVAVRAPVVRVGRDYSCRIALAALPPGVYLPSVLTVAGPVAFGVDLAARREAGEALTGAIATASWAGGDGPMHAAVFADATAGSVGLRISDVDDFAAWLAAQAQPVDIRFSVVVPVYNVARYLGDFFKSLTRQSLDFEQHIELIMVDDGSPDGSARIIKRWQKRYPKAIRYHRKENGGVASARNAGLELATQDWITFIDPDDFVDRNYFAEVARAIRRHGEERVAMVSCNLIFFDEATGKTRDNHPLRFRYIDGEKALPAADLGRFIQLHINVFLRKQLIDDANLEFDRRIRPSFEDAHFFNRYLDRYGNRLAVFLPSARYYYRRRRDRSSLVNSMAMHPEWYGDQLQHGCLALLSEMKKRHHGVVPRQVQYTVLYEVLWRFRHILDRPEVLAFLDVNRRQRFRDLLDAMFALIDADRINDYDVMKQEFSYKVGLLNLFKDCDPPRQLVAIDDFDESKGLVRIVYWSRRPVPGLSAAIDGTVVQPAFGKRRRRDFMGETFCWEHIAWVPIGTTGILSVAVDGHSTTVQLRGVERPQIIPVSTLRAAFARKPLDEVAMPAPTRALRRLARQQDVAEEFRDAWLFQDRLTEADDSAEHLYRWVRRHHPEINAFFVLNGDAPDWDRLADDGFRLITANAPEHAAALVNAAYLISSHADVYVHDRLPRHHFSDMRRFRFVFLQHGVIKDDISLWLNGKPIDCFVTSTPEEFEFVSGDGPFVFSRKEVVLTGLPRHDALLQAPRDDERTMVIMPTWRLSLENGAPEGQGKRTNDALLASHYCRRWKALLHSARLRHIAKATGYRMVFIPHKKIEPDLDAFEIPKGIDVIRFGDFPISPFFAATSLFVTDYSSKAFDVALLNKPVMYYQFDPEVFFEGGHWSRPGYFSYERDGFGPVFTEEHGLVAAIEAFMTGTPADPVYQGRAARTFPFRDGKCCERVFNAILDLERPYADTAPADSPAHVVQARRPAVTGTGRTW